MKMFIFSIIMCGTVGSFFALIVTSKMNKSKPWVRGVVGVLIALAIGLGMTGIMKAQTAYYEKVWNNGVCHECGQSWEFKRVDRTKNNSKRYYWECDDCQEIICVKHNYN